ncbi:MAG: hypothetical protein COA86_09340 [Kangiella sp.]|nr:MAG: hypothetical protein COA86_09340 [Kangiella sp.]
MNQSVTRLFALLMMIFVGCNSNQKESQNHELNESKISPIDISIKLSLDLKEELNPSSSDGFDSYINSEPPESTYHKKISLQVFDAENNLHDLDIYLILIDNLSRTWVIRTKLNGKGLIPKSTNNVDDSTLTESLSFDSLGSLDYSRTINGGIIEYSTASLLNTNIDLPIKLDFSIGTFERVGEFELNSFWFGISGKGFYITSPKQQPDNKLYTRFGHFRLTEDGSIVNRYNESLKVFPVTTSGDITATSLSSIISLIVPDRHNIYDLIIDGNGLVTVIYENNNSVKLGKIALAVFANPQDLLQQEDTTSLFNSSDVEPRYLQSPLLGEPKTSLFGEIYSDSLKLHNPNYPDFPYSIKLTGNEYFLVSPGLESDKRYVYRSSEFRTDNNSFVINQFWERFLLLPPAMNGNLTLLDRALSNAIPLQLPVTAGNPLQSSKLSFGSNLPITASSLDIYSFDPFNHSTYNYSSSMTVFDSLGEPHFINLYFVKDENSNLDWFVYITSMDSALNILYLNVENGIVGANNHSATKIIFNEVGNLSSTLPENIIFDVDFGNGSSYQSMQLNLNSELMTQIDQPFSIQESTQDGYSIGRLKSVNIKEKGEVSGNFSNGLNDVLGQVFLAKFKNESCLHAVAGSSSLLVSDSCEPVYGLPGDDGFGLLEFTVFEE